MKFFIKGFFRKCDQIRSFLRIWSHLLKKSLMKNLIFVQRLKTLGSINCSCLIRKNHLCLMDNFIVVVFFITASIVD